MDKKMKKKTKYSVLLVPDVATEDVKKYSIKLHVIISIGIVFLLIMCGALGCSYFLLANCMNANETIKNLRSTIVAMEEEKILLTSQNEELQNKVTILSDTVNEKVQQEEAREAELAKAFIPSGFPLKGTASYNEEETQLDGNAIAYFTSTPGTNVVASAQGKIVTVEKNDKEEYVMVIDHGNGYQSIYISAAEPKVAAEEEVALDDVLFVIDVGHEILGYQIIKDGTYIDPFELIEIAG